MLAGSLLFARLDDLLKKEQMRFREVFNHFDTDGSGRLDRRELADLVRRLVPEAREPELRYFQVRACRNYSYTYASPN